LGLVVGLEERGGSKEGEGLKVEEVVRVKEAG